MAARNTARSSGVGAMPATWHVASTHASSWERNSLAPRAVTWPRVSARLCSFPLAVSRASLAVPALRTAPALRCVTASAGRFSPSTSPCGILTSTRAANSGLPRISRTTAAIWAGASLSSRKSAAESGSDPSLWRESAIRRWRMSAPTRPTMRSAIIQLPLWLRMDFRRTSRNRRGGAPARGRPDGPRGSSGSRLGPLGRRAWTGPDGPLRRRRSPARI